MKTALLTTLRFKIAFFIVILLLITASLFSIITVETMNRHIMDEVVERQNHCAKAWRPWRPTAFSPAICWA